MHLAKAIMTWRGNGHSCPTRSARIWRPATKAGRAIHRSLGWFLSPVLLTTRRVSRQEQAAEEAAVKPCRTTVPEVTLPDLDRIQSSQEKAREEILKNLRLVICDGKIDPTLSFHQGKSRPDWPLPPQDATSYGL